MEVTTPLLDLAVDQCLLPAIRITERGKLGKRALQEALKFSRNRLR